MAAFAPGVSIKTPDPFVVVDPGIPVGLHVFELVVIDNDGRRSEPTRVPVTVKSLIREPIFDEPILREPIAFPLRGLPGVDI